MAKAQKNVILFHNVKLDDPELKLNESEFDEITRLLPLQVVNIHYLTRSNIRINKETFPETIVVLSDLLLQILISESTRNSEGKLQLKILNEFHINNIQTISYSTNQQNLLIETAKDQIIFYTGKLLPLAQNLYRNIQIFSSALPIDNLPLVRCQDMSLFPFLTIPISPSQKFQFYYYNLCAPDKVEYRQEIPNYIHSLIRNFSTIIDLNQLPFSLFPFQSATEIKEKSNRLFEGSTITQKIINGYNLKPFFKALSIANYISGISCADLPQPNILEDIIPLISVSKNLKILRISHCSCIAEEQLIGFRDAFFKNKQIPITYWDLSNNYFTNFSPIIDIFKDIQTPITFLNLSGCHITAPQASSLFQIFTTNSSFKTLAYLHIKGIEINEDVLISYRKWINFLHDPDAYSKLSHFSKRSKTNSSKKLTNSNTTIEKKKCNSSLRELVIGGVDFIDENSEQKKFNKSKQGDDNQTIEVDPSTSFLSILLEYPEVASKLESFALENCIITPSAAFQICELIRICPKIFKLSIKGTKIDPEDVARIIEALGVFQKSSRGIKINFSNINLNGNAFLPFIRSILEGRIERIVELDLSNNEITPVDFKNLFPLLKLMTNLRSLNISNNFIYSMKEIGKLLPLLLTLPSLKKLSISSDKNHKLGQLLIPLIDALLSQSIQTNQQYSSPDGLSENQTFAGIEEKSQICKLIELDLNGNYLGDSGIEKITKLIQSGKGPIIYRLNGSSCQSIPTLINFVNAVEFRSDIISCSFPGYGAICENLQPFYPPLEFIQAGALQMKLVDIINQHRSHLRMPNDLHFEIPSEIEKFINDSYKNAKDILIPQFPLVHTDISAEFSLPLPFQSKGELPEAGGTVSFLNNDSQNAAYETHSSKKIIIEGIRGYDQFYDPSFLDKIRPQLALKKNHVKTVKENPKPPIVHPTGKDLLPQKENTEIFSSNSKKMDIIQTVDESPKNERKIKVNENQNRFSLINFHSSDLCSED